MHSCPRRLLAFEEERPRRDDRARRGVAFTSGHQSRLSARGRVPLARHQPTRASPARARPRYRHSDAMIPCTPCLSNGPSLRTMPTNLGPRWHATLVPSTVVRLYDYDAQRLVPPASPSSRTSRSSSRAHGSVPTNGCPRAASPSWCVPHRLDMRSARARHGLGMR